MKDLFKLIESADKELKENKNVQDGIIEKIKSEVNQKGYIGIAQINTRVGDFEYNSKKIAKYIKFAEKIGLDAVVFPELSLAGNPLEDIISRHPILVDENLKWLNGLAKLSESTIAYVGFIEPENVSDNKEYHSSIAILHKGKIQKVVRKS